MLKVFLAHFRWRDVHRFFSSLTPFLFYFSFPISALFCSALLCANRIISVHPSLDSSTLDDFLRQPWHLLLLFPLLVWFLLCFTSLKKPSWIANAIDPFQTHPFFWCRNRYSLCASEALQRNVLWSPSLKGFWSYAVPVRDWNPPSRIPLRSCE